MRHLEIKHMPIHSMSSAAYLHYSIDFAPNLWIHMVWETVNTMHIMSILYYETMPIALMMPCHQQLYYHPVGHFKRLLKENSDWNSSLLANDKEWITIKIGLVYEIPFSSKFIRICSLVNVLLFTKVPELRKYGLRRYHHSRGYFCSL